MALLSRQQIQDVEDKGFEDVPVPEWGGEVRLKRMTAHERERFELGAMKGKGKSSEVNLKNFRERLLIATAIDEHGGKLFGREDVIWLSGKSAVAMGRVYDKAMEMNGLSKKDEEELTGNSLDDEDDESSSG